MFKSVLRFVAIILLAAFVLIFPLSLAMRDVGALIFDPETTKILVRDHLFNSELIAGLAQQATQELLLSNDGQAEQSLAGNVLGNALENLDDADWQQITDLTAPTALVEQTVDEVVTAYTDWLNGDAPLPSVKLDLTGWKANAQANAGQVMGIVLDSLPPCSLDQVASMALDAMQSAEGMANHIQACKPPEPFYTALIDNAGLLLQASLQAAPDSIELNQLGQSTDAPNELTQLKTNLTQVRLVLGWSWAAVAAVGLIAVAIASNGFKSFLRWAGWPLLLTGVATLVLGVGLQVFSLGFLDRFLAGPLMEQAGAVGALGRAIAGGALDLVSRPLLLQGLLLSALGTTGIYSAYVFTKRDASPGIPLNQKKIGL